MSEGYKTKFNIGDTVYFIEDKTVYGKTCEHCNSRLAESTVKQIHRSTVTEIFINKNIEQYNLSYPRSLTADKLYNSKQEAELILGKQN